MISSTDGSVIYFPLDAGQPDAYSIVAWLNDLAVEFGRNPTIRAYTELAMPPGLMNNDWQGQISAAYEFVQNRITFVSDPEGTEYVKSPLVLFAQIATGPYPLLGDCDDHCLLLASMLRALGLNASIVGVELGPQSQWFDHVIVSVQTPWGEVDLDPCAKSALPRTYPRRLVAV